MAFVDVGRSPGRSNGGRWTGGQFLAVAGFLCVASTVLGLVALAMAGVGLTAIGNGDASFVGLPIAAVVVGGVSSIAGTASVVMFCAGIIRLGVG